MIPNGQDARVTVKTIIVIVSRSFVVQILKETEFAIADATKKQAVKSNNKIKNCV